MALRVFWRVPARVKGVRHPSTRAIFMGRRSVGSGWRALFGVQRAVRQLGSTPCRRDAVRSPAAPFAPVVPDGSLQGAPSPLPPDPPAPVMTLDLNSLRPGEAPDPADLRVRPAEPRDIEPLARLWDVAFPGERPAEVRAKALEEGTDALGGRETCWVLDAGPDGPVVGGLRLYELEMHLFGQPLPATGVGALAIDPAWREQGLGSALLRRGLRIARDRGDLLAVLYPMRTGYYGRLGFGLAGELHRFRFTPEELPPFPGADAVRVLSRQERMDHIPEHYRRFTASGHGLITRGPRQWRHLEADDCLVARVGEGDEAGALVASVQPNPGHLPSLHVREVMVDTHDTYRALLGWLSRQGEAWDHIVWDALPGEKFEQVLRHPRLPGTPNRRGLWFESATILRGPMVRILNLPALAGRLGVEPGASVTVLDPDLPDNSGHWQGERAPSSGSIGVHLARVTEDISGGAAPGAGALPIGFLSGLLVQGAYPALTRASEDFEAALGISDFRLWDVF
ncbi:MAG: GNAT family N-acetyltransferase [Gemmatimonadales bacterium]|nr:MAG: GNAT family N-acetyltransferase [Gemmatimonadales bacterium]